jgi:hypothetical protein
MYTVREYWFLVRESICVRFGNKTYYGVVTFSYIHLYFGFLKNALNPRMCDIFHPNLANHPF